jgi:hypothetical protein
MSENTKKQDSKNDQNRDDSEKLFFKTAMSDVRIAKDFLSHHLPEDIKKFIDLDTLKLEANLFNKKNMPSVRTNKKD